MTQSGQFMLVAMHCKDRSTRLQSFPRVTWWGGREFTHRSQEWVPPAWRGDGCPLEHPFLRGNGSIPSNFGSIRNGSDFPPKQRGEFGLSSVPEEGDVQHGALAEGAQWVGRSRRASWDASIGSTP